VKGEISFSSFCTEAQVEQSRRIEETKMLEAATKAAEYAREAAWAERYAAECLEAQQLRLKREQDPEHMRKIENQALRKKYGLDGLIDKRVFQKLMGCPS
jgi:hypothetical protein